MGSNRNKSVIFSHFVGPHGCNKPKTIFRFPNVQEIEIFGAKFMLWWLNTVACLHDSIKSSALRVSVISVLRFAWYLVWAAFPQLNPESLDKQSALALFTEHLNKC